MPNDTKRPTEANSATHLPQHPEDPDGSQPRAGAVQQQQAGGSSRPRQQGGAGTGNANQQQQAHSEPLPVPGNSRVDSAPDADDNDIQPERL